MTRTESRIVSLIKEIVDSDTALRQREGKMDAPVGSSDNPSTQIATIPNAITFCRLGLVIIFLVLYAQQGRYRVPALVCYAVASFTDFLDGYIARRTQSVSWLGKIMDPLMDRVLLFSGVLALLFSGELPLWVPVFVIGRDVYLGIGGLIVKRYRARPIDVAYVGKVATALLMVGFCDLLLGIPQVEGLGLVSVAWLPGLDATSAALGIFVVYAGVCCSFATACVYTKHALDVRREALELRAQEEAR